MNNTEQKEFKVYSMYDRDGDWIKNSIRSSYEEADIVVLPGGADVDPSYYGHKAIAGTYHSPKQDAIEVDLFNKCFADNKFVVGICKSAQMATALMGGYLIQDMSHPSRHGVITLDGKAFMVNSLHHQLSVPYGLPENQYEVLAWAQQQSPVHLIEDSRQLIFPSISLDDDDLFKEPEAIWYPKIRCFAIQFHPEYGTCSPECYGWLDEKLIELYNRPAYIEEVEELVEAQTA